MLHCNFKLTLHRIELRVYAAYERIRLFCAGWPLSHWIYCLSFNIHQQAQYITVLSELEPQIWEALLSQWHRIKQLSTMFSTKCKVLARHKNVFGKQNSDILAGIVHGESVSGLRAVLICVATPRGLQQLEKQANTNSVKRIHHPDLMLVLL